MPQSPSDGAAFIEIRNVHRWHGDAVVDFNLDLDSVVDVDLIFDLDYFFY